MILRTQDRIKDDITALMRNTGGRWTDAEIYLALMSTALWSNVHIPLVYSMPNGWIVRPSPTPCPATSDRPSFRKLVLLRPPGALVRPAGLPVGAE